MRLNASGPTETKFVARARHRCIAAAAALALRCGIAVVAAVQLIGAANAGPKDPPINDAPAPVADDLISAVRAGNTDRAHRILESGGNANAGTLDDRTALILAATQGDAAMAKLLLEHGALPAVADKSGNTALHYAGARGNIEVLRVLLDAKAPIDRQNRSGATPLMLASGGGKVAAVRLLLARGANPRMTDYTGRDALDWAQDHRQNAVAEIIRKAGAS